MDIRNIIVVLACVFLLFGTWFMSFSLSNVNVGLSNTDMASPNTIYVNSNAVGRPDGSSKYPWSTIQDGIDNASAGDTVYVESGHYNEAVVISNSLNLTGQGSSNTIINGTDTGAGNVIDIQSPASNVNITGFTIEYADINPHNGIFTDSNTSNVNIFGNIIEHNDLGINTTRSSNISITNNEILINDWGVTVDANVGSNIISYNNISGYPTGYKKEASYGLQLVNCNNANVIDNNITNVSAGIDIEEGGNHTNVIDNNITNVPTGIQIEDGGFENIIGNVENDVSTTGLTLIGCCNSTFENNTILDKGYNTYGIKLLTGDLLAQGNIFSNNHVENATVYGMWMQGQTGDNMSNNTVWGNTFSGCGMGVYLENTSSDCVYHSNFIGTTGLWPALCDGNYTETVHWYQSYPCGGNYWGNSYHGIDNYWGENQSMLGKDMIGDTPYTTGNVNDTYPLMLAWPMPDFCLEDFSVAAQDFFVAAITSYNITSFNVTYTGASSINVTYTGISFNVTSGTNGNCTAIIPNSLLNGAFNFFVGNAPAACCIAWSAAYHMINFTLDPGHHYVQITAEFVAKGTMFLVNKLNQFGDIKGDGVVDLRDFTWLVLHYGWIQNSTYIGPP